MVKINGNIELKRKTNKTALNITISLSSDVSKALSGKTNINGAIDNFQQGKTKDCYLLSELKSISRKSWGKKLINQTIQPDGMGGAYITFKGAKTKEKRFHITVEDILEVRNGENLLSTGDDDVLAVELAYIKYMREMGYPNINGDNNFRANGDPNYKYFCYQRINSDRDIVELLSGKEGNFAVSVDAKTTGLILDKISNDLDNYVPTISFKSNNKYGLSNSHAYEIVSVDKDLRNHKIITLMNPWDSSKKIKINYYDAILESEKLYVRENPDRPTDIFSSKDIQTSARAANNPTDSLETLRRKYDLEHKKCTGEDFDECCNTENEYNKLSEIINKKSSVERMYYISEYFSYPNDNAEKINRMIRENSAAIVKAMDKAEYGWGNGHAKKELFKPLIKYISFQAHQKGINEKEIAEFEKVCYKELDARFYTNENTIINAIDKIMEKIDTNK